MNDNRAYVLGEPGALRQFGEVVDVVLGVDPTAGPDDAFVYAVRVVCRCGDDGPAGCMNFNAGYPWCRPCGEHHRAPECAINEHGRALCPDGRTWEEANAAVDLHNREVAKRAWVGPPRPTKPQEKRREQ